MKAERRLQFSLLPGRRVVVVVWPRRFLGALWRYVPYCLGLAVSLGFLVLVSVPQLMAGFRLWDLLWVPFAASFLMVFGDYFHELGHVVASYRYVNKPIWVQNLKEGAHTSVSSQKPIPKGPLLLTLVAGPAFGMLYGAALTVAALATPGAWFLAFAVAGPVTFFMNGDNLIPRRTKPQRDGSLAWNVWRKDQYPFRVSAEAATGP